MYVYIYIYYCDARGSGKGGNKTNTNGKVKTRGKYLLYVYSYNICTYTHTTKQEGTEIAQQLTPESPKVDTTNTTCFYNVHFFLKDITHKYCRFQNRTLFFLAHKIGTNAKEEV